MPSTYSPNLRIELIASGEQANTWGVTTNNNLGTLIGDAIAGLTDVDVTAADVTLTALDGLQDQARNMMITVSGSPSAARTVFCPDGDTKVYVVANNSTKTVTFSTVSGSGVAIPSGTATLVYCDGVDVLESVSAVGPLNVAGTTTLGTGSGSPIVLRISDLSTGDGGAGTWSTTTDFTQLQFYSADASVPGGANPRYSIGAVMTNSVGSLSALTFRSWSSGTPTERMRLDSGGNLGLGVTPSDWYTTTRALDIASFAAIAQNSSGALTATFNAYQGSAGGAGWVYKTANPAAKYECGANGTGVHAWFNAPVGAAAGDPITFTQAMTLDANGLLGLGLQTSPTYRFDLLTGGSAGIQTVARFGANGNGGLGRGAGILIGASGSSSSVDVAQIVGYQNTASSAATSAALAFQVANSSAVLTEVARFDNSGNLGVGTTSPGGRLNVAGTTTLGTGSGSPIVLRISDLSTGDGGAGTWSTTTDFTQLQFYSADASGPGGANPRYSIGAVMESGVGNTSALAFRSWSSGSPTEKMRLDYAGNLGLGATPSAWAGTAGPALQINKLTIAQNVGFDVSVFTTNGYATSGSAYAYIGAASATQYQQSAGTHKWLHAPVGAAAGDPITFTQAMALDASGNLNISNLTASRALVTDGSKNLASSAVTSTELGYVSGVTSAIQTQLNAKQATITGAATTITTANLTASRALTSNASGKVAVSSVTDTELGYVSGVTSAIQAQLNAKQATITGAATTITSSNLTASRAVVSDVSGKVAVSTTTSTELGYVSGVTSAIQTQLNAKQATITGAATTITSSNLTASRAVVSDASGKVAASSVTSTELGYVSGVTSSIQNQLDSALGVGQTWQNVAGSRVLGTTYTNSTSKPIMVCVSLQGNIPSTANCSAVVSGVTILKGVTQYIIGTPDNVSDQQFSFIVPAGATYSVIGTSSNVQAWAELR